MKMNKGSRTPRGVRGLKPPFVYQGGHRAASHPARGAWIETTLTRRQRLLQESHPARGAWIETGLFASSLCKNRVAPREGCVD